MAMIPVNTFRLAVAVEIALLAAQGLHGSPVFPLGGSPLAQLGLLLAAAYIIDEAKGLAGWEFKGKRSGYSRRKPRDLPIETRKAQEILRPSGSNDGLGRARSAGPADVLETEDMISSDNALLRDKYVRLTRPFFRAQLAEELGNTDGTSEEQIEEWLKSGDIFAVVYRGLEIFPAFQFRGRRPHPTIKKVLSALPLTMSPWQRAFWFVSTNGWLDDKAPAECLDDPDSVVAAAAHEALEVVG
jgi:hypothetical protein